MQHFPLSPVLLICLLALPSCGNAGQNGSSGSGHGLRDQHPYKELQYFSHTFNKNKYYRIYLPRDYYETKEYNTIRRFAWWCNLELRIK